MPPRAAADMTASMMRSHLLLRWKSFIVCPLLHLHTS
jgi:hypothetical protein